MQPIDPKRDREHVLRIDQASFAQPWIASWLSRLEAGIRPTSHVFVVSPAGGPVVGYCALWLVANEAHITSVAVNPSWRRQGAATALMAGVLERAPRLGARRATLEVRASNRGARRLYERLGFSVKGLRKRYYSRPSDDALVLWWEDQPRLETPSTV